MAYVEKVSDRRFLSLSPHFNNPKRPYNSVSTSMEEPVKSSDVVYKDVVVVGGGASGAYSAFHLQEDHGLNIALIEKDASLGGHVKSYTDPETGVTYDYGVVRFDDSENTAKFIDRLGVKRAYYPPPRDPVRYVDFKTGQDINYMPPDDSAQLRALKKYLSLVEKYESMIQGPGYFNFPKPEEIPEDLLLPFGEFIERHQLHDAVPRIFESTGLGITGLKEELTMWVMQAFGASITRSFIGAQNSFVMASHRNQDVYDAVAGALGGNVHYESTVVHTSRTGPQILVAVENHKTKARTTILCKKLLLAIEPTPENIKGLNLEAHEIEVLSKLKFSRQYTGLINNGNLQRHLAYNNLPPKAAPSNHLEFPEVPFTMRFDWMQAGQCFRVTVIGHLDLTPDEAKRMVQRDFDKLIETGILEKMPDNSVSWVAFSDHGAMHARVSANELKDGFIQKFYGLQGRNSTWWTGAAWAVHFQTQLWEFSNRILQDMTKQS